MANKVTGFVSDKVLRKAVVMPATAIGTVANVLTGGDTNTLLVPTIVGWVKTIDWATGSKMNSMAKAWVAIGLAFVAHTLFRDTAFLSVDWFVEASTLAGLCGGAFSLTKAGIFNQ